MLKVDLNLLSRFFVMFMIYSCAGWIVETLLVSFLFKKVVDRGFFIGPYCPIYGFGALTIIIFLKRFSFNAILLFFMTIIVCGILEYFTSWFMEKIFKARWWDYSDKKLNLNGRICLENGIAFGIMGIMVIYVFDPYITTIMANIDAEKMQGLALILWTIFIADFVISTIIIYGFRQTAEEINVQAKSDNTELMTKMVREKLNQKSFLHRRIFEAFPKVEVLKLKITEIKNKIEDATNEAKDKVSGKINDAKDKVNEKTQVIKNSKRYKKIKANLYLGKKKIKSKFKGKINIKFRNGGKE